MGLEQCDQIGLFWKVLATNFLAKVAQNLVTIWANLNYATFSVNFGRKLGYFLFQHLVTVEFDMIQSSAPYAFGHPVYRSKLSQEDWNIRKLLHSVRLWEATVRNSRLVSTYLYSQYLGNAKILGSSFTPEVNVVTHFCKKSRFTLNWRSNNKTINSFKIYFCISHFVQVQASEQTFSIS